MSLPQVYVLDTSAIINDPFIFDNFQDCQIVVPGMVLEELDKLKHQHGQHAKNARLAIRRLDELTSQDGFIGGKITLPHNVVLSFDFAQHPTNGDPSPDAKIIACAYAKNDGQHEVFVVSDDGNMKVRARGLTMQAISFERGDDNLSEIYGGVKTVVNPDAAFVLQTQKVIDPKDFDLELYTNECVLFTDEAGNGQGMGRMCENGSVKVVRGTRAYGISPKNKDQTFALDLLTDPSIPLVSLVGRAGSGKTLIAMAACLDQVMEQKSYSKLVVYKPMVAVGAEIGFVPGSIEEKLAPWLESIDDSLEMLLNPSNAKPGTKDGRRTSWRETVAMWAERGQIEFGALTYIRGRSINNAIILIDEVQNLTKDDVKTILTRVGANTKIILTGDLEQIDNPKLDPVNNGLAYVIDKFRGNKLAANITMHHCERSALASEAARLL
jgi:PhoH-like ATPase